MKNTRHRTRGPLFALCAMLLILGSCGTAQKTAVQVDGTNIRIEFNSLLHSRVVVKFDEVATVMGGFSGSEFVTVAGNDIKDFPIADQKVEQVEDEIGSGQRHVLTGANSSAKISKAVTVTLYDDFPQMAVFEVTYSNTGDSALEVESWTNNRCSVTARSYGEGEPLFWSYQAGSYENRPDWVLPLKEGFAQENFMGMNATDYGGGTPLSDVWRKDAGVAVGHVEMVPKLVSLPVSMPDSKGALLGITYASRKVLNPGESMTTFRTFVTVHQGDHFTALREYRRFMEKQGIDFREAPETAYKSIWCGWGYGRAVTLDKMYGALPMVKKLGLEWVTFDDGWQLGDGDWYLRPEKFPNGDRDMRAFVDKVHAEGFKANLWWAPLAVHLGTDLLHEHPEYVLQNRDGSMQFIGYWQDYYLCPAYAEVVENAKALVKKFMIDWDFDGLKIDGQHLNGVPPCYNRAHNHAYAEESVELLPAFFKAIYDLALSIKPDAVIEICPCGCAYSFFHLPAMNLSVASDPTSVWQVRSKGKSLKAMAPDVAYFGDHVDGRGANGFASTIGVGGVVGTNFTWPEGSSGQPVRPGRRTRDLTPDKEAIWDKWITIYHDKMLSKGEYLGALYDIGFDRPETHVVRRDGKMYYAFYADKWSGNVELRGLEERRYHVVDYVNQVDYGSVEGPLAQLQVEFAEFLLIEVTPE